MTWKDHFKIATKLTGGARRALLCETYCFVRHIAQQNSNHLGGIAMQGIKGAFVSVTPYFHEGEARQLTVLEIVLVLPPRLVLHQLFVARK